MLILPYSVVMRAAPQGVVFGVEWVFTGRNPNNKSGTSAKFWRVERNVYKGPVIFRYGPIGKFGSCHIPTDSSWPAIESKIVEKLKKGYTFETAAMTPLEADVIFRDYPAPFNSIRSITRKGQCLDANGHQLMTLASWDDIANLRALMGQDI